MKPRLAIALAALIVLVGVGLVFGPGWLRSWKVARVDLEAVAALPMETELSVREIGAVLVNETPFAVVDRVATMRIYFAEGCGVLDIGDLRLVRRGAPECRDANYGDVRISTTMPVEKDVESPRRASASGCRATIRTGRGKTRVTWNGIDFEIVEAELRFDGRSFPFGLGPRMLVVEPGNLLVEARTISPRGR